MGLFSLFFGSKSKNADNVSSKSFYKGLKECEKHNSADKVLEAQLKFAFEHESPESAVWWYEHLPQKPNSGSDEDILLLGEKFKRSKLFFPANRQTVSTLLSLVLPNDVDYSGIYDGVSDKDAFCRALERSYYDLVRHNPSEVRSPFLLCQYWLLFHRDKLDKQWIGLSVECGDGETAYSLWYKNIRKKYLDDFDIRNARVWWLLKDLSSQVEAWGKYAFIIKEEGRRVLYCTKCPECGTGDKSRKLVVFPSYLDTVSEVRTAQCPFCSKRFAYRIHLDIKDSNIEEEYDEAEGVDDEQYIIRQYSAAEQIEERNTSRAREEQEKQQKNMLLEAQIRQLETQLSLINSQITACRRDSQRYLELDRQRMSLKSEIRRLKEKLGVK